MIRYLAMSYRNAVAVFLFSMLFLAGCSGVTSNESPYSHKSAAWFSRTKNTEALHVQLSWCAKHNSDMSLHSCAIAKEAYVKIGGQWNAMTKKLFESNQ